MDPSSSEPTKSCYTPTPTTNMPTETRPLMPNHLHSPAAFAPTPQACKVSVLLPPYSFQLPHKTITTPQDIAKFHESQSGKAFLGFIVSLNDSIKGHKISDPCPESPTLKSILEILETMNQWVDQIPPLQQPARYGNPAFRKWQEKLHHEGPSLMLKILPQNLHDGVNEIFPYLGDSFGSALRIDYGTGHEANFIAWLFCLARLGLIGEEDYQGVVSRVFVKYLDLMRKLQTTYWLEPAGSHGVWGLDDYHFLPFVFGSAQLVDQKYLRPKSVHDEEILNNFSHEYMYLGCVAFVKKVKKGPFAEHSPMMNDISVVATWTKVNGGMLKMYKAEVLEKVPIMQHFLFGSIIRWE